MMKDKTMSDVGNKNGFYIMVDPDNNLKLFDENS